MRGRTAGLLGEGGRGARLERGRRRFAAANGRDRNALVGCVRCNGESTGLGGRAVERVDDKALVGRVLERRRGLLPPLVAGRGEVGLRMRERMKLRGAARKGQREGKEQPEEKASAHARIIHCPARGLKPGSSGQPIGGILT